MSKAAQLQRRPRQTEQVVASELDGEAVLLNLTTEEYYSLNDVGTRMWELTDGQHTIGDIVETILSEYDAERDAVTADVLALFDELAEEGLITWDTTS